MTVVAIHQPNFFPWLGFFDKIVRSDVFILLDHVQFQKTGGGWSNRVKLLISGEARWVTAPIMRSFHGVRMINQVAFSPSDPWRDKLLKSLSGSYGRAPFYRETIELIEQLVRKPENNISLYNAAAIIAIAGHLGIPAQKFQLSSALGVDGQATEMLIALTRKVGGRAYMCGSGAQGYQQDAAFADAGIGLIYQSFQHPVYPQIGTGGFVPGLSIIDSLMHVGVNGVRSMLQTNLKSAL